MGDHNKKTKNSNTFRYKSFADRVNEIDLRRLALYHIGHINEELPEENETYFHQTLKKWLVLNLSQEFTHLSKKCMKIVTLPQLIHQKDYVMDVLLGHLATATSLSLQPTLELLYVLARDLRDEFYPYFQRVLDRLICLLNATDPEELEWSFVCLAHLFKSLKPFLKRNIGMVFNAILPLLDEQIFKEHLTNFAVECFSFIARDIRDYKKFLDFILETVAREQVESIQGCGRLLFEMMRGVKGLFHSNGGEFLQFMFESVVDEHCKSKEKSQLLQEIVIVAIKQLLQFIHPTNMNLYWQKICSVTQSLNSTKKLHYLLDLYKLAAEYRDGRYISELDIIVPTVLKITEDCSKAKQEDALHLVVSLVSKIVLSGLSKVTQLDTSRLIKKMLTINERSIFEEFIRLMFDHTQFELLILPSVVLYFEKYFDIKAIQLMADIIVNKQPISRTAEDLKKWKEYPLHVRNEETVNNILKKLEKMNLMQFDEMEEELLLLIVVPHLNSMDKKSLESILKRESIRLMDNMKDDYSVQTEKIIVAFGLIWQTQYYLKFKNNSNFIEKVLTILIGYSSNIRILGLLDQLISENLKIALKLNLHEQLSPLLSSSSHEIRLIAAHCLKTLYSNLEAKTPYQTLYKAELIEPTIHTYRDQLLCLQHFETAGVFYKSLDNEKYKEDILRHLLGLLYQNFKLIWEPVQNLIEEYAKVMTPQSFWDIFKEKLEQCAQSIQIKKLNANVNEIVENTEYWANTTLNQCLGKNNIPELTLMEIMNYRNLLWMRLHKFGKVLEVKNADIVRLFLEFVHEEYQKNFESTEYTWNLLQISVQHDIDNEENDDEQKIVENRRNEDDNNVGDGDNDNEIKIKSSTRKNKQQNLNPLAKSIFQTLISKLSLFASYPNPRALNREKELYALYMNLLAGSNPLLQKLALDCVSTYKMKMFVPYKEHLYNIIDEKHFKDELINFKLDTIDPSHRDEIMKIILRLLYGKMMTRGSQRIISAQARKSIVLRFLGQCTTTEILWFLKMAFGRYESYIQSSKGSIKLSEIPVIVKSEFELSSVWSPRKLQSVVNLLELIRNEFGGLMEKEFQIYMLQLLTFVGSICNEVLSCDHLSVMHTKMPIVYKNVKNAALMSLVNFFTHINNYPWESYEIKCLTEVFVYPTIERLSLECIHTPTPLLKLLLQWGEKPEHFLYLNQVVPSKLDGNSLEYPIFHYIVELLLNERAKIAIRKPIMCLIEKLLIAADSLKNINETTAMNSIIVIEPFIPQILKRLKMNFNTRSSKQTIDKRDLNILSLLTKHVTKSETCDSLLQLLLPILIAKMQSSAGEEIVCQVITTLGNLIRRLETPEIYLQKIAPLFAYVQEVQARKMLCDLVSDIAKLRCKQCDVDEKLVERLKVTARLVLMLNAWDKRWIEQPDYDKRLGALKEITQYLNENAVDLDLGILVIYNCFYFLKYDKDMGLRDNASEHLRLLLPKLTQKYSNDKIQLNTLVDGVFMELMKRVIRDSNDNIRDEGIRLLGVMSRECPDAHGVLADLCPLGDSRDSEVDFFENITHLQSHRHGRALLKFCTQMENIQEVPNIRTLTQFILPLASRYLLHEKHSGKHTLIDAAIETVGIACQLLPWPQYHSVLRYYLTKMRTSGQEYQKQCVRIVVRILDAFHFDLKQADADEETMQQLQRELKEKMVGLSVGKQEKKVKILKFNKNENQDKIVDDSEKTNEAVSDEDSVGSDDDSENTNTEEQNVDDTVANNQDEKEAIPILKRFVLLSNNAARRVMHTISTILIPTLNRCITEKSSYDTKHKVNRKRFSVEREEEEILRVPISLAIVKLMQKLPEELLRASVPGVFLKVCTFLRSPLKSVRMLTRDILKKIMLTLGSSYLPMLVDHLQNLLTQGFQVHVLSVTIHGVLDALRGHIKPADIESCLVNLLEVALNDIFGDITAEKEIEKITAHTPEAKPSAKSYLVLHIIARNIRENCLLDLLIPFREHLAHSHSRKLTKKIQDCFGKIVAGFVENPNISRESLLIFVYGTVSESITDLLPGTQKPILSEKEKEKMRRARPDCYLIQPEPRYRSGAVQKRVKTNAQANAHILIEFGLEMFHIVLKRKKLAGVNYQPFLNPLLPLLKDSLKSSHIRVTTFALKCFTSVWNEEYDLPAIDQYLPEVVQRIFEIIKNFSKFGTTKQEDNLQLMKSVFKAIVALLRKCTSYDLSEDQIDQLVLYIEQDLFRGDSQAIFFSLLKALIVRKVNTKAIHDVMRRMSELSITSHSDFVRNEARAIIFIYVMEYSLKKKIEQIIKFFSVQLCYSVPSGRRSAIDFLNLIIKKFPLVRLTKHAEFLYLSMGTRLVNDEDSDCRKAIAESLEILINRLEKETRQYLFDITLLFFNENQKPSVREMAAALCSRFLNAEKKSFASRLKTCLPIVVSHLSMNNPSAPGRFVKIATTATGIDVNVNHIELPKKTKSNKNYKPQNHIHELQELLADDLETEEAIERRQREIDHEIIQLQYCILKMFEYCGANLMDTKNVELSAIVDELAYESQRLLAHEHSWVRCNAVQIITHIISQLDFQLIGRKLSKLNDNTSTIMDYMYLNPEYDIKSLILDLCAQMIPGETQQTMIDEIVKIFLYVANMLRDVPFNIKKENINKEEDIEKEPEFIDGVTKINLNWLVRNIRFLINREVARASHSTSIRTALFNLMEGLITLLSLDSLEKLSPSLISCLVREMSDEDQHIDAALRQLALHVGSRLRKRIGSDIYDKVRSNCQMKLIMRRAERKKIIAQEKISDPVKAAKRKVSMQERKKTLKKRKTDVMRGKAVDMKQKLKKRKRKAEDDIF